MENEAAHHALKISILRFNPQESGSVPALIIACTLGASSAYMMPVGTPPNAIVFGTGLVRMPQMMKAGIWLNLSGILVITALARSFYSEQENFQDSDSETDYAAMHGDRRQRINEEAEISPPSSAIAACSSSRST